MIPTVTFKSSSGPALRRRRSASPRLRQRIAEQIARATAVGKEERVGPTGPALSFWQGRENLNLRESAGRWARKANRKFGASERGAGVAIREAISQPKLVTVICRANHENERRVAEWSQDDDIRRLQVLFWPSTSTKAKCKPKQAPGGRETEPSMDGHRRGQVAANCVANPENNRSGQR